MDDKFTREIIVLLLFSTLFISCKNSTNLPDPLAAGWKGKPVCEVVKETPKLRVLKCTFRPGVGHEKHYHKPHFGYTLKGSTFKIIDHKGIREVNVKTGSHFSKEQTTEHEVLNIGDSTAVFLIFEPK